MIQNGQMEKAAAALGSRFFVTGTVGHGKRLGSRHNTPTVNIKIDAGRVVPKYGVYITQTVLDGKKYTKTELQMSAFVPAWRIPILRILKPIYLILTLKFTGSQIKVEFIKMLRTERKFANSELLYAQIAADIAAAKAYFDGEKE